jgi:hypothetical protein
MPSAHASGVLQTSTSVAAGGSQASTTLDNATGYGALITTKIVNTGGAVSVPCTATINVSPDGIAWYYYAAQTAGTANGSTYTMIFDVSMHAIKIQIVFAGHQGFAVTVEAQYQQTTAI